MAKVVLGVSGSIAAYKACDLASKLVQAGHEVDVVMTQAARLFVQPLSFSALTHRRVLDDDAWGQGDVPHDHLKVVQDADVLVVAPCTANLMGAFAHGMAGDILSTLYLAATCPVLLAPAMNHRMWAHPRVQANATTLRGDGVHFVGPEEGWLSEAEHGLGRMSEPDEILRTIGALLPDAP